MHTLDTLGGQFTAPENWSEITREQLLFIITQMNSGQSYHESMFKIVIELFQLSTEKLTFLKHSRPKRYEEYCADLLTATEGLFDYLFEEIETGDGKSIVITKKLTRQLLPEYGGFYGPKAALSNVQIWEFTIAEAAFMDFIDKREPKALDRLIATIYRPERADADQWRESEKYNLDDRRQFNDQLIEKDMMVVKEWPQEIKELIFIFFFSCREALPTMFPKIYKNRLKKKSDKAATWTDIILQQAMDEKKEAGQISERNLMIFLRQRELEIENAEYQQDELEKITKKSK